MKKTMIRRISMICAAMLITALLSGVALAAASASDEYIGEAKAKSIALGHAKVTERNATFIKVTLDYDDRRVVYEVDFYSGNTEYDYEIDAISGDIREYDRDIEYYSIPSGTSRSSSDSSDYIGEARAKSIALEHAKIAERNATFIKAHLDYDDGRTVYEIDFYSGNSEYDYEIDAVSGEIREYDHEIEYRETPRATQKPATGNTGEYIGEARAKSIALSDAGLSESGVRSLKAKLDREHGTMVYEVEFKNGRREYEYEIDALSGAILQSDAEYDD